MLYVVSYTYIVYSNNDASEDEDHSHRAMGAADAPTSKYVVDQDQDRISEGFHVDSKASSDE